MVQAVYCWRLPKQHKKPIVEVEERIAQPPLFSNGLTLQDCFSEHERLVGFISPSRVEKLDCGLENIQITQPAISSPPLIALPNGGETVQLDSSEQQSLVEFDATNNGHVFSQDHSNSGPHSKNNAKETSEKQCRKKIEPSLEDIKQQFVNKREYAAKNLGISVSTLKRICRKCGISQWPFPEEKNKGSHKGMGVRSGQGTSSPAQAPRSAKRSAPTVPTLSSQKRICSNSQIATRVTTSTEDAMAKSTVYWSEPLLSGFCKSQTSIVDRESKFTDFEEQAREVEGNKGESVGGEDGVEEEEDSVDGELSRGNSRAREELEEDHNMQWAELPESVIDLPANLPSVHHVDIPSLANEDAIPSELALVPSLATPERPPNPAYHFSFPGTPLSLSAHLGTMTSADQTVLANFPLQGAVGAASAAAAAADPVGAASAAAAAADPASSGQASNNVTRQSHLHEMQRVEVAENVIDLFANQPSVHHVDIHSLAKEDAIPSKLALVPSVITPERRPNPAYHFSSSETPLSLSAHLVTMTSADKTVPANFPLQGAVGTADPACSQQASNNVTQQSHLHDISKKSQFLGFEVSSKAFPLLTQIQQQFPGTFTSFKFKCPKWAVPMLEGLAEFVKRVADTKVYETSEETMQTMHGLLEEFENMGLTLPWLKARLEDGIKVKKHNENNRTYEYSANALEKINRDIKKLNEDYDRASSKLRAEKAKLEVDIVEAQKGLEASGRDLPFSLCIGDSLLKDIIM